MIETLAGLLLPVASWILFASLKSIFVIPLVLLIRRVSARWLTLHGRYGLWFAVIACLSIPFGVPVKIGGELPGAAPALAQVVSEASTARHEQPIISIVDAPAATTSNISTASTAILLWLVGVVGLAIAVLHNTRRYRRITSGASNVDAQTNELFGLCRQMLNIRRHVRLRESSRIESPVVVGYWRPTLLLPLDLSTRISNEQLRLVLLHELSHVRRHDILANWLITFVQIAHWFNPLTWYALRIMRNDMEHACDASVLHHLSTSEQVEYGNTLIRLSGLAPQRTLLAQNACVIENPSQLKARINMIAQFRSRSIASSLLGAALITLASGIAVTQAANAPQQPTGATSQVTPQTAAPPQAKPEVATGKAVASPAPAAGRQATNAPKVESIRFQINHAKAAELASFIKSAPGMGLLSGQGSIAVDEESNSIFVQDTAKNVSTIRQLVTTLDVPLEKVRVDAFIAWVDSDLVQELMESVTRSGAWSPAAIFGPDQRVMSLIESAHRAHRAEIISSPVVTVANRSKATIAQNALIPLRPDAPPGAPLKNHHVNLAFTPTLTPDKRMTLDIDFRIDAVNGFLTTPGNAPVPSIDTSEAKSQINLSAGETAMLTTSSGPGRRLVVFLTPKLTPQPSAR